MNVNRKLLYLGVFLATAGGVLLLAQAGLITEAGILSALGLWPLAVIAIGAAILLRGTRFALAGGLVAAILPGLLLGGLAAATPRFDAPCADISPASMTSRDGTFGSVATVELRLACGDVTVTTTAGATWRLDAGGGGTGAIVDADAGRLSVRSADGSRSWPTWRSPDTWRLALPTGARLDLVAEVDAGRGRFDLGGARLGNVDLAINAGDTTIDLASASLDHLALDVNAAHAGLVLPAGQDTAADIEVNAGSVAVCVPDGVGLRLREGASNLSTVSHAGLVRTGDAWQSPDYATTTHHADVSIATNVGSVDINPEGGCK